MDNHDDTQLLRDYATRKDEKAFAELVRRHIDLVFSAALRRTWGDVTLAEDLAQKVFADLAAKAHRLPAGVVLAGWLYRHTCFLASSAVRAEARRRQREQAYAEWSTMEQNKPDWSQLAPELEDAMQELADRDRDALLLRFFKQEPLRQVGIALGVSEDAARMRVDRALARLRDALMRRGIKTAAGSLGMALSAQAVTAAPAGLAASVSAGALAAATAGAAGLSQTLLPTLIMSKTKIALAVALAIAAVSTPLVLQHRDNAHLRRQNARLQEQLGQLGASPPQPNLLAALPAPPTPPVPPATNTAPFDWRRVESSDYRQYVANLRAIGCPEKTLRDIILADVSELYRQRIREAMPANRFEYWRPGHYHDKLFAPEVVQKLNALKAEQRGLLQTLLGGSFPEQTDALQSEIVGVSTERMLDFLGPQRVAPVLELEQRYAEQMVDARAAGKDAAARAEALKQLLAKRDAALLTLLTPEEKFEYELRCSQTANAVRTGLGDFEPTEPEFREIVRLRKQFDDAFEPGGVGVPDSQAGERAQAEKALQAGLKAALGEARYERYQHRKRE